MGIGLGVGVGVAEGVGVIGGVGVSQGTSAHSLILTVSTRQPSPEPVVSLTIRQRSISFGPANGMVTTVVMKPPELPLQA